MLDKVRLFFYRTVVFTGIAVVVVSLFTGKPAGALFGGFIAAAGISGVRKQRRR